VIRTTFKINCEVYELFYVHRGGNTIVPQPRASTAKVYIQPLNPQLRSVNVLLNYNMLNPVPFMHHIRRTGMNRMKRKVSSIMQLVFHPDKLLPGATITYVHIYNVIALPCSSPCELRKEITGITSRT